MYRYQKQRNRFEPVALLGVAITILLHGGTVVGIILYRKALQAAQKPPPVPSFVVAKLLRFGKPKDPKKLPNKIVPTQATQTPRGVDYTADADSVPSKKTNKENRLESDRRRDALRKVELLAQAQKEIEAEGSPEGVVHGSATEAGEGDAYMTRIADLWNRTWSLPIIIPHKEAKTLYVLVVLKIDKNGEIEFPIQFDRKSGNHHFDSSIEAAWRQIKTLPIPPPDRMASILAQGLALKLNWEGME
ncbi:MAG: TonB C-terminal domain-containing protein [Pseudomonadota bacterium]